VRALQVVPPAVQVRVTLILGAALLGLGLGLWLLRTWPGLQAGVGLGLLLSGGYVGWCRWPRWRWGIGRAQLAELPQPTGQPLRLSFDDGPTPGVTDAVLDLLAQAGVKASFFVLLAKARRHPELVRRIAAHGHILGLHGEDHRLPFGRSAGELMQVLAGARAELAELVGQPIELYRPSHGIKTLALVVAVHRAGLRFCFWDYGVWDTDAPPPQVLVRRLRAVTPAPGAPPPGPTILLHDGLGDSTAVPPHAAAMTAALQQWLAELQRPAAPARR
jgi:peptidoglycan/xylan/chitin deacetylase (PgdA/CDA1 family)